MSYTGIWRGVWTEVSASGHRTSQFLFRLLPTAHSPQPTVYSLSSSDLESELTELTGHLGKPLNIGRKTRSIPPALRRALNARDKGCRFPGCSNTKYVDAHHIHHWADGGETKVTNLVSLCRFHHRLVHEGDVGIERLDDGAIRLVKPDGNSYDSVLPGHTSGWTKLLACNVQNSIHIDKKTAITRWCGERMDYGLGVEVLLQQWRRGKGDPGGTPGENSSWDGR